MLATLGTGPTLRLGYGELRSCSIIKISGGCQFGLAFGGGVGGLISDTRLPSVGRRRLVVVETDGDVDVDNRCVA